MATLSAGQLVDLRTKRQASSINLSVLQPTVLLSALVNGSFSRGARSIDFDTGTGSGFATIEAGQTLIVTTADGDKMVRVKSASGSQVSGSISLAENAILWGDNQAIQILHEYQIWPIPPTIRSGVFYKDFTIAYTDGNLTPNPVCIIGSHRVGTLSAGSVAFALNSSSSYAIASGASISSRVWSCVHNGGATTGISFSSTTAANPTLTITEAGQYWLKCVVTDSNSKTQATYRALFVYDNSTLPYKDFTVSGLSGDWQQGGYRFSAQVTGDVELSDFPDRTLVVLWYDNTFNGTSGYVDLWGTDAQNVICSGYLRRDQDNDELSPKGTGSVSFEVTTPEAVMDACSLLGSVSLNAVTATPTTWYQYASWMTVGRAIHHLLKWHSTVLETCDVYGLTTNTLGVENTDFTEPSLLQMVNGLGFSRGHFAKMISDRRGRLHFVTDSQMLNDAGRGALDTVCTLSVADISGVVDVVRQEEEAVSVVDLDGFYFSGSAATPWIAIAPGYIETTSFNMPEFRGSGGLSIKNQVLNSTQADSNEKAGRVLAQANNNPFEVRFTTPYNGLGAFDIVPSIGWYSWGIANSVLKRGASLNGRKLLCRHVDHAINHQAGTIQTSVVFEPEALGPDGIAGNYPKSYPVPVLRVPTNNCNSLSLGSPVTFAPGLSGIAHISMCALSATKFLVVYEDLTNANRGGACVLDVTGTTVTAGTPVAFGIDEVVCTDVAMLTSTTAIVSYIEEVSAGVVRPRAIALSISGTTITPGTAITLEAVASNLSTSVAVLSPTRTLVAYHDVTNSLMRGVVVDVSGTTLTANTPATLVGSASGVAGIRSLTSTTAFLAYRNASDSDLDALIVSGITTTFTVNAGVEIIGGLTLDTTSRPSISVEDDDKVIVAVWSGIAACSISGTTISSGSAIDPAARNNGSNNVGVLSSRKAIFTYRRNSDDLGLVVPIAISGTSVSFGSIKAVTAAPATYVSAIARISNTRAIITYQDSDALGKARIVTCG